MDATKMTIKDEQLAHYEKERWDAYNEYIEHRSKMKRAYKKWKRCERAVQKLED